MNYFGWIITYLHILHQRPVGVSNLLSFKMNLTVFLSEKIRRRSLAWSFCITSVEGMNIRWRSWSPSPYIVVNNLYGPVENSESYLGVTGIWWVMPTHIFHNLIFFIRFIDFNHLIVFNCVVGFISTFLFPWPPIWRTISCCSLLRPLFFHQCFFWWLGCFL